MKHRVGGHEIKLFTGKAGVFGGGLYQMPTQTALVRLPLRLFELTRA